MLADFQKRRQDSDMVQTVGKEGAGGVAVRNKGGGEPCPFSFSFAC